VKETERLQWVKEYAKCSDEDLRQRLLEVESAIRQNLPDAERFHFERELIRRLLKTKE
jgi:hypothetical protein